MHRGRRRLVELEHGPATVGRILAPPDEPVPLQLGRQLARRGQREAEGAREAADGLALRRRDVAERGDVPATELRVAAHELGELRRRAASRPEPPQHLPEAPVELAQLVVGPAGNTWHLLKVIIE